MQVKVEQLPAEINRKGLSPVYLLSGDEPLQLNEASDFIRCKARESGVEERVVLDVAKDFDWNRLIEENANMSLFASTRLIELRMGTSKPGLAGGKVLTEYAEQLAGDNVLLITCNKLEKRVQNSKWYKSLNKVGVTTQVWPIDAEKLPNWISQRIKKHNKTITADAAQLIADRVEGNMLAASQEIDKLCLLVNNDEISFDDVVSAVTDSTRFDVFGLVECAYANETKRLLRMLDGLKSEGLDPMAIYGPLMWDYRRLCTMGYHFSNGVTLDKLFADYRIWDSKRKQAIKSILQRHDINKLYKLLKQANALDRTIKSAERHTAWDALLGLLLAFSGHNINPATD
ncbi:MAG: DNA polymerase III subunit delta [Gammaproteobacteria bacterium]|nr:MAG: DNA polymerase III subunit delta [Gammaproteobacteria bacterium]